VHDQLPFIIEPSEEVDEYFKEEPNINKELYLLKNPCSVNIERDNEWDVHTDEEKQKE
jgi:hypothetical protein